MSYLLFYELQVLTSLCKKFNFLFLQSKGVRDSFVEALFVILFCFVLAAHNTCLFYFYCILATENIEEKAGHLLWSHCSSTNWPILKEIE